MDVAARQQAYLKIAAGAEYVEGRAGWSALLAKYHAGDQAVGEQWANVILDEIDRRQDCADFRLNLLLRAVAIYGGRMAEATKRRFWALALAARYYGGFSRDYPMFYSSENHHLCWAAAEYLVAQRWPEATFGFDGRSAKEHLNRARFLIARWIEQRARWGYREWNSACYSSVNAMSLLNLADFAAEEEIRRLAADAMTQMLADLAADSIHGGVWGAQRRLYEHDLFRWSGQSISPAFAILLGAGDPEKLGPASTADFVATTSYRAPDWLCSLACDVSKPMINLERHREERGHYYTCHSIFWKPPAELIEEKYRTVWHAEGIYSLAVRTERRAEYIVSAMTPVERQATRHEFAQSMVWLSSLRGKATIFTTHPYRPGVDRGDERYWAGTAVMPMCHLSHGVLAAVYAAGDRDGAADFSHAHFPTQTLSQWHSRDRWYFGRMEDAFVAICAPPGAEMTAEGKWAGREIKAPGRSSAWLAMYGCRQQDGDFESFCRRAGEANIQFDAATAVAEVRAGETAFRLSYNDGAFVNDGAVRCDYPNQIDNPVIRSVYGEPTLHVQTPAGPRTLDFTAAGRIAVKAYAEL